MADNAFTSRHSFDWLDIFTEAGDRQLGLPTRFSGKSYAAQKHTDRQTVQLSVGDHCSFLIWSCAHSQCCIKLIVGSPRLKWNQ